MLIKTGDAKIIDVVDTKDVEDDKEREKLLSTALDKAREAKAKAKENTEN